jgi:hypothetical protein
MARFSGSVDIGDVLVTREGPWWVSAAIRFGARLRNRPGHCNHVIVVHHRDEAGTLWGIEGRPGGVGWRDLSGPLSWPLTNANNHQPKTDEQRAQLADIMVEMLGRPYDWRGIAEDTRQALGRSWGIAIAREWKDGDVPGEVVCSSLADYAYERVGLQNPGGGKITRGTTPGDWDWFMIDGAKQWPGQ